MNFICLKVIWKVGVHTSNTGPFGRMRIPGVRFFHGRFNGSATIGPGDSATRMHRAMGLKSARKWTELLFTRIFICSGSTPPTRYSSRSSIWTLLEPTTTLTPSVRRQAVGPRLIFAPHIIGPLTVKFPLLRKSMLNVPSKGWSLSAGSPPNPSVMVFPTPFLCAASVSYTHLTLPTKA